MPTLRHAALSAVNDMPIREAASVCRMWKNMLMSRTHSVKPVSCLTMLAANTGPVADVLADLDLSCVCACEALVDGVSVLPH